MYTLGLPDGPPLEFEEPGLPGGHGELFFVKNPPDARPGVVSVLARPRRTLATVERLTWLSSHLTWSASLAWPQSLIYENGQPAGYWTAVVRGARPLRAWLADHADASAFPRRLRIGQNLARAVQAAHAKPNRCVLANLTPESILVLGNETVQLLNLDTCQVTGPDGTLLFPARPELSPYSPPEANTRPDPSAPLGAEWDWYSLAAVFSELLTGPGVWPQLSEALALGLDQTPAYRLTAAQWLKILNAAPPPPQLLAFSVLPTELTMGEPLTVQWRTKDAAPVRLYGPDAPGADLDAEGEMQLFPKKSGTYTLNAQGVEARQEVVVRRPLPPPAPPPLPPPSPEVSLEVAPTEIRLGQSVTLRWKTRHAGRVTLSGPSLTSGPVAPEGEQVITPQNAGTLVYRLQAIMAVETAEQTQQVVVRPPSRAWIWMLLLTLGVLAGLVWWWIHPEKPRIVSFTASKKEIREGEKVTLRWNVENAGSSAIRLSGDSAKSTNRPPLGQTTTPPSLRHRTAPYVYELTVGDTTAQVQVTISPRRTPTSGKSRVGNQLTELAPIQKSSQSPSRGQASGSTSRVGRDARTARPPIEPKPAPVAPPPTAPTTNNGVRRIIDPETGQLKKVDANGNEIKEEP